MCGIAGIAGRPDAALIQAMTDTLVHRGPDGEGHYTDDAISLGHRRLSIIDLAGGAQPMSYADGRYWITYNGEVYNFQALRRELESHGHVFETRSDTEVLLAAYACWGEACVERFRGMFAFALWDSQEKRLFLARDPVGVKPLYYAETGEGLYFASEMKALLICPGIDRELDLESLDDYLTYLYTVPPRTIYRGIKQLPPGHCASWNDGRLAVRRYWQPCVGNEECSRSEEDLIEEIDARLADIMSLYRVADVPLGAFLSGGLDSAAITRYLAGQDAAPMTFTVGFGEEGALYDESVEARALAALLGTQHHELKVTPAAAELLPRMVRHFDEPFGNPTALLTWSICELVREHVTVVLSGDGGDEAFGGYPRYRGVAWAERYRMLPALLRRGLINPLVQLLPESVSGFHALRRIREFSAGTLLEPVDMYAGWVGYYSLQERRELYNADVSGALRGRDSRDYIRNLARECGSDDPVSRAMYVDALSFLPNNVLQYGDRMSMAHSLEVRVPLADPELLSFLMGVPGGLKIKGGRSKHLLRGVLSKYLPPEVVNRKKAGFNPPMGVWLNGPLREVVREFLSPEALKRGGLFNPAVVTRMLEDHGRARRDYTWHLWALIVFEQWRRLYGTG